MSNPRPQLTTATGLSTEAAACSVAKFFAAINWEPPKLDPRFITAAMFFAKVAGPVER